MIYTQSDFFVRRCLRNALIMILAVLFSLVTGLVFVGAAQADENGFEDLPLEEGPIAVDTVDVIVEGSFYSDIIPSIEENLASMRSEDNPLQTSVALEAEAKVRAALYSLIDKHYAESNADECVAYLAADQIDADTIADTLSEIVDTMSQSWSADGSALLNEVYTYFGVALFQTDSGDLFLVAVFSDEAGDLTTTNSVILDETFLDENNNPTVDPISAQVCVPVEVNLISASIEVTGSDGLPLENASQVAVGDVLEISESAQIASNERTIELADISYMVIGDPDGIAELDETTLTILAGGTVEVGLLADDINLASLSLTALADEPENPEDPGDTTEPDTTEPDPDETTEPEPDETTEPETTEPEPDETTEPETTEPEPDETTEPDTTEPETTEPETTEPETTEPETTEPETTEPEPDETTEPETTEPETTEPETTEPEPDETTEPDTTEPETTEPETTEPEPDETTEPETTEPEPEVVSAVYTISFEANGGSGQMDALLAEEASDITLTANAFTREGYDFSGWNTSADGSGASYLNGQTITLYSDLVLYAQWTTEVYVTGVQNNLSATTTAGVAPTLPETASIRWSDETITNETVTWSTIDPVLYANQGSFEAIGTVLGYTVKCTVSVEAAADTENPETITQTGDTTNYLPIAIAAGVGVVVIVVAVILIVRSRKSR